MLGEKQRAIAEFFGRQAQVMKACEEMAELNVELDSFTRLQHKDTLEHALNECNDLLNVLEGIYIQLGGCIEEIHSQKEYKLNRAINIINQIPPGTKDKVKAYNEIRYRKG